MIQVMPWKLELMPWGESLGRGPTEGDALTCNVVTSWLHLSLCSKLNLEPLSLI